MFFLLNGRECGGKERVGTVTESARKYIPRIIDGKVNLILFFGLGVIYRV